MQMRKGDRVRLNAKARRYPLFPRSGDRVGVIVHEVSDGLAWVRWDGRKNGTSIHVDFLEPDIGFIEPSIQTPLERVEWAGVIAAYDAQVAETTPDGN